MNEATDFYSILGVARTATADEIKEAFRFLSHAYHPDKFATEAQRGKAEEQFKKLNHGYHILSDPAERARYDASRAEYSDPWAAYQPDEEPPPVPVEMALWKQILRWIAVLPGAAAGATVALSILNLIAYFPPEDGLAKLFAPIFANGAWGWTFIFSAAYIAPRAKITVAIIFAAICLSAFTLAALVNVRDQNWWHLLSNVALLTGSIIAAVSITKGEEDVGQRL
jgi:curved DNA-binding protein CbpA